MTYVLQYHELVVKEDIPKLSWREKQRVKDSVEQKLVQNPEVFGKPLRRSLRGYRRLRVGSYRVVFKITGKNVKIFAIKHRSAVYERLYNRF